MKTKQLSHNCFGIMTKFLILPALIAGLAACSSEKVPVPQKISNNLDAVPYHSKDAIIAIHGFDVPKDGAPAITEVGPFQLDDNIYQSDGHTLLIPRHSILEGVYHNDGTTCHVSWVKVYPSIVEYQHQRVQWDVVQASSDSYCNAKRGIKSGDRLDVKFNPN